MGQYRGLGQIFREWDVYNLQVIRIIQETHLLLHGYDCNINVNEMDDDELSLRHLVLNEILAKQARDQEIQMQSLHNRT